MTNTNRDIAEATKAAREAAAKATNSTADASSVVTTNPTPDEVLIGLEMVRLSPRRYASKH